MERSYIVDFNTKSCDCKRWQLTGIPCHHVIACCRTDRIDAETLVHSCYTVETYKEAYSHNLMPLRGRSHWEKTNGSQVHPPLYTKVMGRPKKNRKKSPEEKLKKGDIVLTKHGVTMHCSICRKPDHNRKGHDKYVERQQQQQHDNVPEEDEEFDDPSIMQVIFSYTSIYIFLANHFFLHKYLYIPCSTYSLRILTQLWIQHIKLIAWCTRWAKRTELKFQYRHHLVLYLRVCL